MTAEQYGIFYARRLKLYEREAFNQIGRYYRGRIKEMPRWTDTGYEAVIRGWLTYEGLAETYQSFYDSIGRQQSRTLTTGLKTGRLEVKAQNPFNLSTLFNQSWSKFLEGYFKNNYFNRIVTVNEHTANWIVAYVFKEREKGASIDQIQKGLEEKFGKTTGLYGWQLRRIARTESAAAANLASLQVMNNSPFVFEKVWITAEDERVRAGVKKNQWNHAALHKTAVNYMDYFIVSNENGAQEALQYPADPNGTAGNVINCRCAVAPRIARHPNGLPKRKDGANNPANFIAPTRDFTAEEQATLDRLLNEPDPSKQLTYSDEEFERLSMEHLPKGRRDFWTHRENVDWLTPAENFVIRDYSDTGYIDLNRFADGRTQDIEYTAGNTQETEAYYRTYGDILQEATNKIRRKIKEDPEYTKQALWNGYTKPAKAENPKNIIIYRGQRLKQKYWKDIDDIEKAFRDKKPLTNPRFWSTSTNSNTAAAFMSKSPSNKNVFFEIEIPRSTATPIRLISMHPNEDEIIMTPDAQYEVISVEIIPEENKIVDLFGGKKFITRPNQYYVRLKFIGYE